MFYLFLVSCLIFAGKVYGQNCGNQAQAACGLTFVNSFYPHLPDAKLVCGDLSILESCIRNISCLTTAERNNQINQARTLVANKTIICPNLPQLEITCQMCVEQFIQQRQLHNTNDQLLCSDFRTMESCVNNDKECSSEMKLAFIDQNKKFINYAACVEATTRVITTTPKPNECTTTADQCIITYLMMSTQHGPNPDLLCGDLSTMEKCILDSNCGTSNAEKETMISQTKNQLQARGVTCGTTTTRIPISTTPSVKDGGSLTTVNPVTTTKTACKTLVDNCYISFVVASSAHTTDADLTCRDFSTMEKCIAAVCDSPDAEKTAVRNQVKTHLLQKYNISCVYGATYPTTKSPVSSPTTAKIVTTAIPTTTKITDSECQETVDKCVFDFIVISTSHGPNPTLVCGDLLIMETCIMAKNCGMTDTEKQSIIDQNTKKLATRGVMCGTTTKIPVQTTEKSCLPDQCMSTFLQSITDHNGRQELMCGDLITLENCILNLKCRLTEIQKNAFIAQSTQLLEFQGILCDCNSKVLKCQNIFMENYSASNGNQDLICSHQRTFEKCIQAIDCISASNKTILIESNKQNLEHKGSMCDCVNGFSQCQDSYQNAAFNKPITKALLCTHIQTFMKCIFDLSSCELTDAYKDNLLKQTKDELDARKVPCDIYKVLYGTHESSNDEQNSGPKLISQTSFYLLAAIIVLVFKL